MSEAGEDGLAREIALLRRFSAGEILPAPEAAELAHLLPPAVLQDPPEPRLNYRHTLDHYAAQIGCDARSIKRWVSIGRGVQPPALPPFDDRAALFQWWQTMLTAGHVKQRPSQKFLDYCRLQPAPPTAAIPSASVALRGPPPPVSASVTVPGFDFSGDASGGLEQAVQELRRTVVANQRRLSKAMTTSLIDESFVASCQRNVEKSVDLLRKIEADLFEMQKKRGDLVPLKDVREDWSTLLMSVRMMRTRSTDNICADLAGQFTPEQLATIRTAVTAERLREEKLLRTAKHWTASADVPPQPAGV